MEPLKAQGESPGYAEPFPLPPLTSLSVDSSKKPPGTSCKYPGCTSTTREFVVFQGRDYCHEHIGLVKAEAEIAETFRPLEGTGEP